MSEKTIAELKQSTDIVKYIGSLIELKKKGSNFVACCPFHGEETPSFTVSPSKQIFKCFGGCGSGDIFDFIEKYHKLNKAEGIKKLEEFRGIDHNYTAPKNYKTEKTQINTPEQIQNKLNKTSTALLNNASKINIFKTIPVEIDNQITIDTMIHEDFIKLFEKKSLQMTQDQHKKILYITKNILTYDTFFNCPAIIIKDHQDKVVDICKYRPKKPAHFDSWGDPKYMYIKEEDKLKDRGSNFLFPFSKEMDQIIDKNSFFFIGEGLKNALVCLLHSIPFISLESTSNEIKPALKEYIKEKAKNKFILGGFDGDGGSPKDLAEAKTSGIYKKGLGAYLKAKETLELDFNNLFDFSSNIDMADYLSEYRDLINFESNFKELFLSNATISTKQDIKTTQKKRKYKKFIKSS